MLTRKELIGEEGNSRSGEIVCEDNTLNNFYEIETEITELDGSLNVELEELRGQMVEATISETEIERALKEIDFIEVNVDQMKIKYFVVVIYDDNFYPVQDNLNKRMLWLDAWKNQTKHFEEN